SGDARRVRFAESQLRPAAVHAGEGRPHRLRIWKRPGGARRRARPVHRVMASLAPGPERHQGLTWLSPLLWEHKLSASNASSTRPARRARVRATASKTPRLRYIARCWWDPPAWSFRSFRAA